MTVLTAAIPSRLSMLGECVASVAAQTWPPLSHLIAIDYDHAGPGPTYQRLLEAAPTEWVTMLADDDLADPIHLQTMGAGVIDTPLDVIYTYCRSVGRHTFTAYNQPFDRQLLETSSIVSGTALFRRSLALSVGGLRDEWGEDWSFWKRMSGAGARFRSVPKITWSYRFTGDNLSWGEMVR
jgi:hypothetical protein